MQARAVRAALRALEEKLGALEQQQEAVLGTPLPDDGGGPIGAIGGPIGAIEDL